MTSAERKERIKLLTKQARLLKEKWKRTNDPADLAKYHETLKALQKVKRIQAGFEDIMTFAKQYFTGSPPHDLLKADTPSPPFHYELTKTLRDAVLHPYTQKIAVAAPRSHAKSTIVTNIFPIWCVCYLDDVQEYFWAIIGASQDKAKQFLDTIKSELEDNELLIEDFGKLKGPTWNALEIITANGVKISAHGAGEALRGMRFGSYRPSVLLDDLETDDSVQTPERIDKLYNWLDRTVLPLGDPKRSKFFMVGTILHYNSVLNQVLNNRPDWKALKYKAISKFPERMDLWNQWEEMMHNRTEGDNPMVAARIARDKAMKFYEENKDEMHRGAEVLWPERMDLLSLMEIRSAKRLAFNSEYQNEPVDEDSRIFNQIHFYEPSEVDIDKLEIFGACDPSLGKSKRADPSVILTAGRDPRTGIVYVLDVDVRRRNPERLIQDIFAKAQAYNYKKFSIETIAFQQFLKDEISKRSAELGIYLPVVEYRPGTSKKEVRIAGIEPMISNGYIRILPTQQDLIEQLTYFPKAAHDDILDCLVMVSEMTRRRVGALVFGHLKY